jgi:hypothetical protein
MRLSGRLNPGVPLHARADPAIPEQNQWAVARPGTPSGGNASTGNHGGGNSVPAANQATAPGRLSKAQRKAQALEYRLLGATYSQIADKLKCSKSKAFGYVREALAEITEKTRETAEQYRAIHLARNERMVLGLMQQAAQGDVYAVDRILKLQEEQWRLIPGLEVPNKHEIGGMTDGDGNVTGIPIKIVIAPEEAGL